MKRVVFSILTTIVGLVALLSFKSQSSTTVGAGLPSATLNNSGGTTTTSPSPGSGAASGPPNVAQSSPVQAAPSQSTPTPSQPTTPQATPTKAAPTKAAPTKAAPTKAATTTSVPPPSPSKPTPVATSKTYDGSAVQTRYGTVQVAVTVKGGTITNVTFLQLTNHDGHSADINSQAAPILLQETLSAQSSNIDAVSGATFTSDGYFQSLQSALDQAGLK